MKKNSVLVRRAALLAAIAVSIAVAVGLSVSLVIDAVQTTSAARPAMDSPSDEGAASVVEEGPSNGAGGLPVLSSTLISGAAGLIAAAVAIWLLAERVMRPAMVPVARLRDVAVAMSEGDLEIRADEAASDELGELGKAVNQLSFQLSRNMYTLIVDRNRLRNMLNGLSEGIVAIDAKGEITHTNPAMDRFFTRQKLALHLPDPRMKLIPDRSIWEDFDTVIRTKEPMSRTLQSRDMILRLTITPIVDEIDSVAGAVGLFSDITQMERLEKTRRDYVSNVSHELRTPLTAMRALIEPLKEGMVTEEEDRQRYYDIILREILRLSRLINDQLELSRLQSGTLAIQKDYIALDDVVYDVSDRYAGIAREQGLQLLVETDFTQCPRVYSNADRVEQLLVILVDNAIKYTQQGSVSVSADWDEERVVLHVKDTGIGIEEEDLPYVFDRFYKVDKAHSGKGSGLGLSIARELLRQMDEDIWVTSEKDVGTEFSFTLHRQAPAQDDETDISN
ncbi:MAG: HAMP domain-containing protein [Clostridia bacterium]|nr:HAMP domain-containing protein [Clostridia bacterium]